MDESCGSKTWQAKKQIVANIYTTIQQKVNQDKFDFSNHSLEELAAEKFKLADAVKVILAPHNRYPHTDDKSHSNASVKSYFQ